MTKQQDAPAELTQRLLPGNDAKDCVTLQIRSDQDSAKGAAERAFHYEIKVKTTKSSIPIAPRLTLDLADGTQATIYLGFGYGSDHRSVFMQPRKVIGAKLCLALWHSDRQILYANLRQIGQMELQGRRLSALAKLAVKRESWKRAAQALGWGSATGAGPVRALREIGKLLLRPGPSGTLQNKTQGVLMPPAYWFCEYEILLEQATTAPEFAEYSQHCDASLALFTESGASPTTFARALLGKAFTQCQSDIIYGDSLAFAAKNQGNLNDGETELRIETRFPFSPEYFPFAPDLGGVIAIRREVLGTTGPITDFNAALAQIPQWAHDGLAVCYLPAILSRRPVSRKTDKAANAPSNSKQAAKVTLPADKAAPPMSIIIPTKNAHQHLRACLHSLGAFKQQDDCEIIIVQNNTDDPEALAFLKTLPAHIKRVEYRGKFNYAGIMNFGTKASSGMPFIVHLNDDTELLTPDALSRLCKRASQQEVGAVGPKLLFGNDLIQHAGMEIGDTGGCNMIGILEPSVIAGRDNSGYRQAFSAVRDVSALTGACIAMRRQVFDEVGGYDETLAVTYNDVDLCLKIAAKGYRIVYDGTVQIRHHASVSRGRTLTDPYPAEAAYFRAKHADLLARKDKFAPGLGRLAGSGMRLETPFDAAQISLNTAPICYQGATQGRTQISDPENNPVAIARKHHKEQNDP